MLVRSILSSHEQSHLIEFPEEETQNLMTGVILVYKLFLGYDLIVLNQIYDIVILVDLGLSKVLLLQLGLIDVNLVLSVFRRKDFDIYVVSKLLDHLVLRLLLCLVEVTLVCDVLMVVHELFVCFYHFNSV